MSKWRGSSLALLVVFAVALSASAQDTWPTVIDGTAGMGPYAWLDGPASIANGQAANAVRGGAEGSLQLYVCRSAFPDGVHPGKFFNNECNVSWDSKEVVKTTNYELLINREPSYSAYLGQAWVNPGTAGTFVGGNVNGTPLRVCHGSYNNAWHPGKEWRGKCLIGYDGHEVATDTYQLLALTFNKTAWQQANATVICTGCPAGTPTNTGTNINWNPTPQPVVVSHVYAMTNGFWMKEGTECIILARPALAPGFAPKDAIAAAVANDSLGHMSSGGSNCFERAPTWFIRDDLGSGWFRIRYVQTSLCLQPRAGDSVVTTATCSNAREQWWRWTGDFLISGLTPDEQVNAVGTAIVLPECPGLGLWVMADNFTVKKIQKVNGQCVKGKSLTIEQAPSWRYDESKPGRMIP